MDYNVDGIGYSVSYKELRSLYRNALELTDKEFMSRLPEMAHLACIIGWFKELGNDLTIGDKGVVHEIIHLMEEPDEPTNELNTIRRKFKDYLELV